MSDLERIGLTEQRRELTTVACGSLHLKQSRSEREQIGGNGFTRPVADAHPSVRDVQSQVKDRLEIGLVEAWESAAGMVGDEECVEVIIVTIERLVAAASADGDAVLAMLQTSFGDDDVFLFQACLYPIAINHDEVLQLIGRCLKINLQVFVAIPEKRDGLIKRHWLRNFTRNRKSQPIAHIGDVSSTVLCQLERDTILQCHGTCHESGDEAGDQ